MQAPDALVSLMPKDLFYSPVFYNIINPFRLVAGSLWIVALHVLAAQKAQDLPLIRALPVTILALIPYFTLVITYVH